jgi:tRNA nucleotidyltransferase (CCA-adding enzyme)
MPDFLFLLESRLNPDQYRVVEQVQAAAHEHGLHLYLVGGALRDLIYGYPIRDLDFAVEGQALKVAKSLLKNAPDSATIVSALDEDLRSAYFTYPSGLTVEISACRVERRGRPGQKSRLEFCDIYDDLRRRDFSMNAIALSLNPKSRGLLLDPNNGVADIERHEIRTLTSYAFSEDPVRLMRAVRFRTRLRFNLEERTEAQFRAALESEAIKNASPEGLHNEFREMGREENPLEILKALEKEGLTAAFHPRLAGSKLNLNGVTQAHKMARSIEECGVPVRFQGPFFYFLQDKLPARDRADLMKRMAMKRSDQEIWMDLEPRTKKLVHDLAGKLANTPSKAYKLLSEQPGELLLFILMKFPQKKIQDKVKNYLHRHRKMRDHLPKVELESLGEPPGTPRFQQILDIYFYALLDGKVRSSKEPLKPLKKAIAEVDKALKV